MTASTRSLQREVLIYLKVHGAQRLDELEAQFAMENIAPVLEELRDRGDIVAVELDQAIILIITESGLTWCSSS